MQRRIGGSPPTSVERSGSARFGLVTCCPRSRISRNGTRCRWRPRIVRWPCSPTATRWLSPGAVAPPYAGDGADHGRVRATSLEGRGDLVEPVASRVTGVRLRVPDLSDDPFEVHPLSRRTVGCAQTLQQRLAVVEVGVERSFAVVEEQPGLLDPALSDGLRAYSCVFSATDSSPGQYMVLVSSAHGSASRRLRRLRRTTSCMRFSSGST